MGTTTTTKGSSRLGSKAGVSKAKASKMASEDESSSRGSRHPYDMD